MDSSILKSDAIIEIKNSGKKLEVLNQILEAGHEIRI